MRASDGHTALSKRVLFADCACRTPGGANPLPRRLAAPAPARAADSRRRGRSSGERPRHGRKQDRDEMLFDADKDVDFEEWLRRLECGGGEEEARRGRGGGPTTGARSRKAVATRRADWGHSAPPSVARSRTLERAETSLPPSAPPPTPPTVGDLLRAAPPTSNEARASRASSRAELPYGRSPTATKVLAELEREPVSVPVPPRPPPLRKVLGQHVLVNEAVAARIVQESGLGPGDLAIEVGPGRGALTRHLLAAGCRVVAIEKDEAMVADLRRRYKDWIVDDLGEGTERKGVRGAEFGEEGKTGGDEEDGTGCVRKGESSSTLSARDERETAAVGALDGDASAASSDEGSASESFPSSCSASLVPTDSSTLPPVEFVTPPHALPFLLPRPSRLLTLVQGDVLETDLDAIVKAFEQERHQPRGTLAGGGHQAGGNVAGGGHPMGGKGVDERSQSAQRASTSASDLGTSSSATFPSKAPHTRSPPSALLSSPSSTTSPVDLSPFKVRVVANLPFYLTTPFVSRLLKTRRIAGAVLLLQKEVSRRLALRSPGGKGWRWINAPLLLRGAPRHLFDIPSSDFVPAPKAQGGVLRLDLRDADETPPLPPGAEIGALARDVLRAKRKVLRRALVAAGVEVGVADQALRKAGIAEGTRADTLSPARLAHLAWELARLSGRVDETTYRATMPTLTAACLREDALANELAAAWAYGAGTAPEVRTIYVADALRMAVPAGPKATVPLLSGPKSFDPSRDGPLAGRPCIDTSAWDGEEEGQEKNEDEEWNDEDRYDDDDDDADDAGLDPLSGLAALRPIERSKTAPLQGTGKHRSPHASTPPSSVNDVLTRRERARLAAARAAFFKAANEQKTKSRSKK